MAAPQAPGFFGVFELFGKEGLGLYGVSPDAAVTWAVGFHALSYIPITVMGAWYLSKLQLHLSDFSRAGEAPPA